MKPKNLSKLFYVFTYVIFEFLLVSLPASPVFSKDRESMSPASVLQPAPPLRIYVPNRVTGENITAESGPATFTLNLDAQLNQDTIPEGQIHYLRPEQAGVSHLEFSVRVKCMGSSSEGTIVVGGVIDSKVDSANILRESWAYVIVDSGSDSLRIVPTSEESVYENCTTPEAKGYFTCQNYGRVAQCSLTRSFFRMSNHASVNF